MLGGQVKLLDRLKCNICMFILVILCYGSALVGWHKKKRRGGRCLDVLAPLFVILHFRPLWAAAVCSPSSRYMRRRLF